MDVDAELETGGAAEKAAFNVVDADVRAWLEEALEVLVKLEPCIVEAMELDTEVTKLEDAEFALLVAESVDERLARELVEASAVCIDPDELTADVIAVVGEATVGTVPLVMPLVAFEVID